MYCVKVKSKQQQLVIKPLLTAHEGNYTCNISNKWGKLQHSIVVEVEVEEPKVIEKPENQTVAVGMDTHLKCVVDSRGLVPSIYWAKVGEGGTETRPNFTMIPEYRNKQVLVLRNVTKKDQGLYACVIRTDAGNAIERAYVHVLEDYEAIQQAPVNTTAPPGTTVNFLWVEPHPKSHSGRITIESKLIAIVTCVFATAILLVIVNCFIYKRMQKEQKKRIFVERNHIISQPGARTPQTPQTLQTPQTPQTPQTLRTPQTLQTPQEAAEHPDTLPPSYDEAMFGSTKGEEAFNRRLELFAQDTSFLHTL